MFFSEISQNVLKAARHFKSVIFPLLRIFDGYILENVVTV